METLNNGHISTEDFLIYRDIYNADILEEVLEVKKLSESDNEEDAGKARPLARHFLNRLIELSEAHGFSGNLWHTYLTSILAKHENAYSTACEIRGQVEGSINEMVLHDFALFHELFNMDMEEIAKNVKVRELLYIADYRCTAEGKVYNKRIRDRICELACRLAEAFDAREMKGLVTDFYREFGVGKYGLNKAFRIEHDDDGHVVVAPITNITHAYLEDLVGYEIAKQKLIDNTEAFINGKPANNCLLYGDAGTGKSSSIKGILNKYYDRGLRIIEVYKHQFVDLNDVIAEIKSRNYKFILYMDDLSFEDFEIEYKYLKAVIEGGLEKKPSNVLIYATSNRRHIVRESINDRAEIREDMHTGDTVQEKLSLSARFGVTIYFGSPVKKEFNNIVKTLAERNGITMDENELMLQANQWELSHGGLSGRTAQNFINYLLGKE